MNRILPLSLGAAIGAGALASQVLCSQSLANIEETGTARVEITVAGFAQRTGQVEISLYADEAAWDGNDPLSFQWVAVTDDSVSGLFEGLPAGNYAIRLYHDANDDGMMNMNAMGIPSEKYAFSNNVHPRFRGANYGEAVFTLEDGETRSETLHLIGAFD